MPAQVYTTGRTAPCAVRGASSAPRQQFASYGVAIRRQAGAAPQARPERCTALGVTANAAVAYQTHQHGSAAGNGTRSVSVTFKTVRKLEYGQVLKVVGSGPELGNWDCSRAPAMAWSKGDRWQLTVNLGPGDHEFKVAIASGDGNCLIGYEDGPNRTVKVPETDAAANRAFTVNCEWGSVASWLETLLPEDERKWKEGGDQHQHNQHHNHHSNSHNGHNGNGHNSWAHLTSADMPTSVEGLQREVTELRRQLAARSEEAAAFSRACDQLRGERDSISEQLRLSQEQLRSCQGEREHLAAVAAKSQKNIDLLRQVGELLSRMHEP